MLNDGWSPEMVVGRVKKDDVFSCELIPSTSTLYHWINHRIQQWINNIPRKILGCRTAQEAFLKELRLLTS